MNMSTETRSLDKKREASIEPKHTNIHVMYSFFSYTFWNISTNIYGIFNKQMNGAHLRFMNNHQNENDAQDLIIVI